jgi:EAL domain-containing protein (putative c-di-GMP-specific phosphodiesterase class I)
VQALVDTAGRLGKRTIAEFVEDAATSDLLRQLGVDYAQGWHVGRPGPLPQLVVPAAELR